MLTEVKLYGELGEKYGKSFNFDVYSVAEAIAALSANFSDFLHSIKADGEYNVFIDNEDINADELVNPSGTKTIKIVPVISGSKGVFKIVLGAALIFASSSSFIAGIGSGKFGALLAAGVKNIGFSLLFGGIAELLFKPPSSVNQEPIDSRPSELFQGAVNTVAQGGPVPVGYGRLIVGSTTISAGINSRDLI